MSKQTCPRRLELSFGKLEENIDSWREDGTCTYCGSLNPAEFFKAIISGIEIGPTDKNYKCYVAGGKKFYFQHLTKPQQEEFIRLLNAKQINIGYPSYFYALPYFCKVTR